MHAVIPAGENVVESEGEVLIAVAEDLIEFFDD